VPNNSFRWQSSALEALQEAAEAILVMEFDSKLEKLVN
jgi:histone H3/H4